jgi:phosphohistidine phosphatase
MRRLLLFRHGKSEWDDAKRDDDHERSLAKRGIRAATLMGRFCAGIGMVPDQVITSSAVRARKTIELAMAAGGWQCPVRVSSKIYEATTEMVLNEVLAADSKIETLMIVGHEPTLSSLVSSLIGGQCRIRLRTAAIACIEFEADAWSGLRLHQGCLLWLVSPRELKVVPIDDDLEG